MNTIMGIESLRSSPVYDQSKQREKGAGERAAHCVGAAHPNATSATQVCVIASLILSFCFLSD
ncbi:hypothetical protein [Altericroceibacterium xinjiangense]|uniref:hypothetical protein n=1 Tax=Altericroceibacterium xinjiangense TaxID=762261 RepID=UPI0013E0512D|nr:hypothetical protein [Altericroceibacterium xinjiangense]